MLSHTEQNWNAVAIHHNHGAVGLILLAQKLDRPSVVTPKLVLRCYNGHCFLAEALLPNMDSGRGFAPGKEEVEVAQVEKQLPNVKIAGK